MTERLDVEMVRRSLARSRSDARNLIRDGSVMVGGKLATRPAAGVDPETDIEIDPDAIRWVSRGGAKLTAALDAFAIEVDGRRCIDGGASTGGFTQVLLRRGAAQVVAIDVGHGQLAASVAADARVTSIEGLNVRAATPGELGGCFDLLVADLSFISIRTVAPSLAALVCDGADAVVLIKPEFEVGRAALGHGGVVRDEEVREAAVRGVIDALDSAGLGAQHIIRSPVKGGDGNVEYLVWAVRRAAARPLEVPG